MEHISPKNGVFLHTRKYCENCISAHLSLHNFSLVITYNVSLLPGHVPSPPILRTLGDNVIEVFHLTLQMFQMRYQHMSSVSN